MGFVISPPHPVGAGADAAGTMGGGVNEARQSLRGPAVHPLHAVWEAMQQRQGLEPAGSRGDERHIPGAIVEEHARETRQGYRQV